MSAAITGVAQTDPPLVPGGGREKGAGIGGAGIGAGVVGQAGLGISDGGSPASDRSDGEGPGERGRPWTGRVHHHWIADHAPGGRSEDNSDDPGKARDGSDGQHGSGGQAVALNLGGGGRAGDPPAVIGGVGGKDLAIAATGSKIEDAIGEAIIKAT